MHCHWALTRFPKPVPLNINITIITIVITKHQYQHHITTNIIARVRLRDRRARGPQDRAKQDLLSLCSPPVLPWDPPSSTLMIQTGPRGQVGSRRGSSNPRWRISSGRIYEVYFGQLVMYDHIIWWYAMHILHLYPSVVGRQRVLVMGARYDT